jgi:hypothetical protein
MSGLLSSEVEREGLVVTPDLRHPQLTENPQSPDSIARRDSRFATSDFRSVDFFRETGVERGIARGCAARPSLLARDRRRAGAPASFAATARQLVEPYCLRSRVRIPSRQHQLDSASWVEAAEKRGRERDCSRQRRSSLANRSGPPAPKRADVLRRRYRGGSSNPQGSNPALVYTNGIEKGASKAPFSIPSGERGIHVAAQLIDYVCLFADADFTYHQKRQHVSRHASCVTQRVPAPEAVCLPG